MLIDSNTPGMHSMDVFVFVNWKRFGRSDYWHLSWSASFILCAMWSQEQTLFKPVDWDCPRPLGSLPHKCWLDSQLLALLKTIIACKPGKCGYCEGSVQRNSVLVWALQNKCLGVYIMIDQDSFTGSSLNGNKLCIPVCVGEHVQTRWTKS